MWQADSVQLAIDGGSTSGPGGRVNTYYELGFSLVGPGKVATYAWDGNVDWSSIQVDGHTNPQGYLLKIKIPWKNLGHEKAPSSFGVNVVINGKGPDGQRRFVEWTPGTARVKNRDAFALAVSAARPSDSLQNIVLDHRRYNSREVIKGRFAEYSPSGKPADQIRFVALAPDGSSAWTSDWLETAAMEKDSTRTINFQLPAAALGADGDYEIRAEQKSGASTARRTFRVEDVETRIARGVAEVQARAATAEALWKSTPEMRDDAYVKMGFSVVGHYLPRLGNSSVSPDWRILQIDELGRVLQSIENRLATRQPIAGLPPVDLASVTVQGGTFVAQRPQAGLVPIYLYGYGHFSTVAKDIPLLVQLGASLIQQEDGPKALFAGERSSYSPQSILDVFQKADDHGMKIDFLLAPHYFPEQLLESEPGLSLKRPVGVLKYNIDHPTARTVLADWIATIVPALSKSPALLSICLSNEPTYSESGRDSFSHEAWANYLEQKHHSIAALNELYGTSYSAFAQVPVPEVGMPSSQPALRAYFDWIKFNQSHFADWHRWLNEKVKAAAPQVPTHAKIMTDIFDRAALSRGIDPELICNLTDLAGNDSYAWPKPFQEYAYDWRQVAMWYDLLHSFKGQPVFNSENHLILDGSPPVSISPDHSRCVLWQGALHHLAATATWVWEEPTVPDLEGSLYMRPANVFAMGEAMLDLTRLAPEVAQLSETKPEVALLYSVSSLFWDEDYPAILASAYAALTFMGHPVTFLSENQLIEGRRSPANENVRLLILPGASHVSDALTPALLAFQKNGGAILALGADNLRFDEYARPRTLPPPLANLPALPWEKNGEDRSLAQKLRPSLQGLVTDIPALLDTHGQPAWGVAYRIIQEKDGLLLSLTNFLPESKTLSLPLEGTALDLVSQNPVNLKGFTIEPMKYLLLRFTPTASPATKAAPTASPSPPPSAPPPPLHPAEARMDRGTFFVSICEASPYQ